MKDSEGNDMSKRASCSMVTGSSKNMPVGEASFGIQTLGPTACNKAIQTLYDPSNGGETVRLEIRLCIMPCVGLRKTVALESSLMYSAESGVFLSLPRLSIYSALELRRVYRTSQFAIKTPFKKP